MALSEEAKLYIRKAFGDEQELEKTDPEFYEFFSNFAYGEVRGALSLDEKTAHMSQLAVLLGCGGVDEFREVLPAALNCGVSPEEAREVVYQAVAYLGLGRVRPFIKAMNEVFSSRGINLPLAAQGTTCEETRLSAGNQAQVDIFGEGMREFWKGAPEGRDKVNYWLADNCFGDYYTRGGLDVKTRELLTFSMLVSLGGCESQVKGHIQGNANVGNGKATLLAVVTQLLPYIGYPRTLNAIACLNEVIPE